jgi:ABC-type nitrate/sulfonate/bicarbonate transport system substrate-binding protein
MLRKFFFKIGFVLAFILPVLGQAQTMEALNITVFPGAQNLPLWVATEKGFFREQGLDLNVTLTMNSEDLRNGLINGKFQIAHSAVDNSVAIVVQTGNPSVIMGDSSMNELFVHPISKHYRICVAKNYLLMHPILLTHCRRFVLLA